MAFHFPEKLRVSVAIAISVALFFGEMAVAYKTGSLALMADAFHILNDIASFCVTLLCIVMTEKPKYRQDFSFGWQRARLLGAFFNGSILLALGLSIFLQSIERFVSLKKVEDPMLILIMGGAGFVLNMISLAFLHEHKHHLDDSKHDHHHGQHGQQTRHAHYHADPESEISLGTALSSICPHRDHNLADCPLKADPHAGHRHANHTTKTPGRDLGMMAAAMHAVYDAITNLGVIVAALVIWLTPWPGRFYLDPAIGMAISLVILWTAIPLAKRSGVILLQSAPQGVNLGDIKHDLEQIPGILSVHELHVWRLDQAKAIATAHLVVSDPGVAAFMAGAQTISECLHAYGIHSATLQPELRLPIIRSSPSSSSSSSSGVVIESVGAAAAASSSMVAEAGSAFAVDDDGAAAGERTSAGAAAADAAAGGGGAAAGCQILCGRGACDHLMCCSGPAKV